ncbi:MAG: hypothetical protein JWO65_1642, partial [Sphingomonas bacterium]|nr:hypothetical protein [Sphingomonas bacterium]
MIDRRSLIGTTFAGGAFALMPGAAFAKAIAASGAGDPLTPLLASFAEELFLLSPESASQLGLDSGAHMALKSKLSDGSTAGRVRSDAQIRSMHARLLKLNRAGLSTQSQILYDTVRYATERGIDGMAFKYGGGGGAGFQGGTGPYVLSQQNGAVSGIPEFLVTAHKLTNAADFEAYLSRTNAFARQIDQEAVRIREDAAIGVMPPRFIADNAMGQLKEFRATPAAQQRFVTYLGEQARKLGIAGDWAGRATKIVETAVYPALDREIAAFAAATANAPMTAGVQRLPDGDAYYRWALRLGTTTTQTPEEVHRIGLAQNEEIKARMDALLKAQGMTKGSVGERVTALNKDPKFLFPNTDEGRAQLIAYLNGKIAAIRPLMPKISKLGLNANVMVKRVPPEIQDGA